MKVNVDVGCASYFEFKYGGWGVKKNLSFITCGTGLGIGSVVNGQPCTGLTHPEGGHQIVNPLPDDVEFEGVCPYHKNCIEGYVTNVAIAKRAGLSNRDEVENLKDEDPIWDKVAFYLAVACLNTTFVLSPEIIVLDGGVLH